MGLAWPAVALRRRPGAGGDPAGDAGRQELLAAAFRLRARSLPAAAAAGAAFLRRRALSPDRPEARTIQGIALLERHEAKAAHAALGPARAAGAEAAAFWDGEAAWDLEDDDASASAFAEAGARPDSPYRGEAAYREGWAENRRGRLEAAAARFADAARADPMLAPAADLQRGWVLLQAGRIPEARPLFEAVERAAPRGPHAPEAIVGQAECAYRTGELDAAAKLFDSALARVPDPRAKGPLRYSLAWTAYRQKRTERARGQFLDV